MNKVLLTIMVWCASKLFEFADVKRDKSGEYVIGVLFTNEEPKKFFEEPD